MKNLTKTTLKIYWQHCRAYPWPLFFIFFGIIGGAATNVAIPWYFKKIFDTLNEYGKPSDRAVEILLGILLVVAIIEFAHWFFNRCADFAIARLEARTVRDLTNYCFNYLQKHSVGFFNNNFVGSLTKRVNRFASSFEYLCDRFSFDILPLIFNISFIVIVLFQRNYWVSWGLIGWITIFVVVNMIFVHLKLPYDIKRSDSETAASGVLADTITNQINIKLFGGYNREVKNFGSATEKVCGLRILTWNMGNIFNAVQAFLIIVLEIGMFYMAIKLWRAGQFTVGDFVLVQGYILNVMMQIWNFGRTIQRVYEDLSNAEDMSEILMTSHEITDAPGAKYLKVKEGKIKFENVDFFYHSTRSILKKLNLEISPGEKVALVGPSGAGKSTIVKMLLRLHEIDAGKILIDGQNISQVTLESLWKNVSQVPQDPVLFHRSLAENIKYGRPAATRAEIEKAAKLAHCHEFIKDLPDGYDTYVGERGIKLSGGERQRVAIARAILHNAPILVLDEATSSLDSESERLIQDALGKLIEGKTVIVVAHRLSTIMKMDRIIVIDAGKIAEQGSHSELLKKPNGLYRKLWQVQAGGFIQ